jgi:lipopolysaccharide transport system ATP-binding protein
MGWERVVAALDTRGGTISAASPYLLRDINFEIERGSLVCITGNSGSGKSTLLKLLAGRVPPTCGRIELHDRVASLLSIGENLRKEDTALENLEKEAQLQRMTGAEAKLYRRRAISFAGLREAEMLPIGRYSTGMRLRLSVAMALMSPNASIFLFDDIMEVGDIAFQKKFLEQMRTRRDEGCTFVMVSDNK